MAREAVDVVEDVQKAILSGAAFSFLARFLIGEVPGTLKSRGTYGIRSLFERCGVSACAYNGQPKEDWTREILLSLQPGAVLRVLERVTSPAENGSEESARLVFDQLNAGLLSHGFHLSNDGSHLWIAEVDPHFSSQAGKPGSTRGLVDPDFEQLDISEDEARRLTIGWDEAVRCYGAGAYLAATIMLGSLLEAVLLLALKRNRPRIEESGIKFIDNKNQERPIEKWSLNEMIEAASKLGWTTQKITSFAHSLREYRNYVHPELRRRLDDLPKTHECLIGSVVVSGAVRDLRIAINFSR